MKSILSKAYSRLLADLASINREPLIEAHWNVSETWARIYAPQLDKAILRLVEDIRSYDVRSMSQQQCYDTYFAACDLSPNPSEMKNWLTRLIDMLYISLGTPPLPELNAQLLAAIRIAHQSLVFCYKAEYTPDDKQIEAAYSRFLENDGRIAIYDTRFADTCDSYFYRLARSFVGAVIYRANWFEIFPQHGPGATYPGHKPWTKGRLDTYYPAIDQVYSYSEWQITDPRMWAVYCTELSEEDKTRQIVCNVTAVPKDSRGPRIICVHPAEAIWIQQGTRHVLEQAISSNPLTRGRISFHDQRVNGNMALRSSLSREFCTLDLKDASDTLSNALVAHLFGWAYQYIGCSRAVQVRIGDRVVRLNKFASMGNALCFPVQSLVYWALVRAGIYVTYGVICNDVYVFGDDVLFPSKYYDGAISALVRGGLTVNTDKTFYRGSFRESCGVDACFGVDITPLRMKEVDPSSVSGAIALCDLAKRARKHRYNRLASLLYAAVSEHFGPLGLTNDPDAQGMVEYEDVTWPELYLRSNRMRFNRMLQRWEVPTKLVKPTINRGYTHEWYHVQESLRSLDQKFGRGSANIARGSLVPGHATSERGLEYPVPHRERLECGWTQVVE